MTAELLTFIFGLFGTLLGGAVTWGMVKVKIENLLRDMQNMQTWKDDHEHWSNNQNTQMIEKLAKHSVYIEELQRQLSNIEKRALEWKNS